MPTTGLSWLAEASAVFVKEWRVELRERHGLAAAGLFGTASALAFGLVSSGRAPDPAQVAASLCVLIVLVPVVALPRTFLVEADQGTFDFLRLNARPDCAVAGKAAFAAVQGVAGSAALTLLLLAFSGAAPSHPGLLAATVGLASLAVSSGVSLCGALALGSQGRYAVAAAVSLPLLIPTLLLAYPAVHASLGGPGLGSAWRAVAGLAGWGAAQAATAPLLGGAAWRLAHGSGGTAR
jgi:heme exporter protein B